MDQWPLPTSTNLSFLSHTKLKPAKLKNKSHEWKRGRRYFSCVLNYVRTIIIVNDVSMLVFPLARNTDGNIKMLESRHVNYNTNWSFRKENEAATMNVKNYNNNVKIAEEKSNEKYMLWSRLKWGPGVRGHVQEVINSYLVAHFATSRTIQEKMFLWT